MTLGSHYENALGIIEAHPEDKYLSGPKTEAQITEAELRLGVTFPAEYRDFVSRYGAGEIQTVMIYGVIDDIDDRIESNVVFMTLEARESDDLPETCVLIYHDGMDHTYVMDTSEGADPALRAWMLGNDMTWDQCEVVARSFGEFLEEILIEEYSRDPED